MSDITGRLERADFYVNVRCDALDDLGAAIGDAVLVDIGDGSIAYGDRISADTVRLRCPVPGSEWREQVRLRLPAMRMAS